MRAPQRDGWPIRNTSLIATQEMEALSAQASRLSALVGHADASVALASARLCARLAAAGGDIATTMAVPECLQVSSTQTSLSCIVATGSTKAAMLLCQDACKWVLLHL